MSFQSAGHRCFPTVKSSVNVALLLEAAYVDCFAGAREFTDALSSAQSRRSILVNLIAGEQIAEPALENAASIVGRGEKCYLALVDSSVIRNQTQRLLLVREMENVEKGCLSCEIGERVVFLVGSESLAEPVRQVRKRFDSKSATIGVSMPMTDLTKTLIAYRQAAFACDARFDSKVRYCSDLAMPFMLDVLRNEPAIPDLLHPAIAGLAAHDERSGSELLRTLESYVACGCDQTACARNPHVHLNTLKYRLGKISDVTRFDLKDPKGLFYLQLSFALAE